MTLSELVGSEVERNIGHSRRVDADDIAQEVWLEIIGEEVSEPMAECVRRIVARVASRHRKRRQRLCSRERSTDDRDLPEKSFKSAASTNHVEFTDLIDAVAANDFERESLLVLAGVHPAATTFRELCARKYPKSKSASYRERAQLIERFKSLREIL